MRPGDSTILLVDAVGADGLDRARCLFRSYADEFADSIAETLCFQDFEAEVTGLPGRYAPPSGCLILAMEGETPAGCVALRDLGDGTCEMKRLYVAPSYRGRGVGRLLVGEVVRGAEWLGYRRMVLDSMPEMTGALALYREFGFVEMAPYWDHPTGRAVFMERPLGDEGTPIGGGLSHPDDMNRGWGRRGGGRV
jgi:putative acetyltransferase